MPSNILNKISEKLTGHEDQDEQQHSNKYQRQQSNRGSDDTEFGDYQSDSNSRSRNNRAGRDELGDHQRGAFAETSKGPNKSWDNTNNNMNARGYNSNSTGMGNEGMDEYGQTSNAYRESVNSSKQQKQNMNSYDDDQYGSSRNQRSSGRGFKDSWKSAADDENVQQGNDYVSNNF